MFFVLGAMGAFSAFYLLGMYPVPATRQYLLSSPFFSSVSFFNPVFNSTTTIKANGFEGNAANGTGGKVFVEVCVVFFLSFYQNDLIFYAAAERDR